MSRKAVRAARHESAAQYAGNSTEVHHYPGTFHGSGFVTTAAVSRRMAADRTDALRRALG
ncbi:hypothetical protein [Kribbella sandramycini]|uniref:Uncharacterized protein n=1 Tax=Kribbella sandramycini TaxID=60450 RepID=A0A841SG75_9ACTN|nr:hypothetical protein [Kribbella sandramycini]MBB6569001.1 hypothetical protein [Kribbella sandramycini]